MTLKYLQMGMLQDCSSKHQANKHFVTNTFFIRPIYREKGCNVGPSRTRYLLDIL